MKKKRVAIGLGIVAVVIVVVILLVGPRLWLAIQGVEKLSGPQEGVPKPLAAPEPVRAGQADWPCWRGPNGDGISSVTGIRTDWSGGLKKLWEVNFLCQGSRTPTWSEPVVRGNRLVVPGRDETNDLIFCLDPESGAVIWTQSYYAMTLRARHGPGPRATPYIDDDRVYTFGRHGHLACWQLLDGRPLWKCNVEDNGGAAPHWGHSSSPLVYEDKVFVQGGGQALVVAYDKMTGKLAWKALEGKAGYAAIAPLRIGEATKLLVFHGTALACLDLADGTVLWQVPWETKYDVNASTPIVAGQTIFITSGYGTGCQALTVGEDSVETLWRNDAIASHHSDPAIIDGHLYGYSGQSNQNRGDFKCVELQTGAEKWSTGALGWGTFAHVDGHLLCQDIKGNLFLVKPDPNALAIVTEMKEALGEVSNPAWTVPTVANGKLYLRYMQRLICYDLINE
ncbi:MAG: PQQ-like beta-propeller repeat protein [Phycisphaerales bacterium]|nr:MAG: PQQ-like beta-propeller repeat protein [Phycisphaerales bacterium]